MTQLHALARLALASAICAGATTLPLAVLGLIGGNPVIWLFAMPVAIGVYGAGIAVFGLPLLWLWPAAFKRSIWRGIGATIVGGSTIPAILIIFDQLPANFDESAASIILLVVCGSLAGFVWWYLNFEAAP